MAENFSLRLQRIATARGLTSGRSRSGVDVAAMAAAAGISYEMARRYAEGIAQPKPEVLRKIAAWLGVSASWLMYGEGPMESGPGEIDVAMLESCLAAVEEAQRIAGVTLTRDRAAALVADLYHQAASGAAPSASSVASALRALAL